MNDNGRSYSSLSPDEQEALSVWIEGFERRFNQAGPAAIEQTLDEAPAGLRAALLTELLPLAIDAYRQQHRVTPTLHELRLAHPNLASEITEVYTSLSFSYRLPVELHGYRVIRVVGDGGQAVVLRAQDDVHSTVAIKLSTSPEHNDLLLRERRILGECDHPGIVSVIGSGMHEEAAYFVMPYLKGKTLADRYATHRPDTDEAARIARELCGIVDHLHGHGILHRDIKPANVWIDDHGGVKLIDLGMAIERDRWGQPVSQLREFHGTPAFMSPEQAATDGEHDGELSDIFSIGATLYWMGTGSAPFVGDTRESVLERATKCDFQRGCIESAQGWPKSLVEVCLKSMEGDATERYRTANELAEALDAVVPGAALKGRTALRMLLVTTLLVAAATAGIRFGPWLDAPDSDQFDDSVSWIHRIADREGVNLSALDASSFTAEAYSTLPDVIPWGAQNFSDSRIGLLRVTCEPELEPIAEALEYRLGDGSWRTLRRASRGSHEDDLSLRDLRQGGRLAIRLGGRQEQVAAGPFQLETSPSDDVLTHATSFIHDLIQEARIASCFSGGDAGWSLSNRYAERFAPLIESLRFGTSLGEPLAEIQVSSSNADRRLLYAKAKSLARNLKAKFSASSLGMQGSDALWVEIDFIDGSSTGPCRFRRSRVSDSQQASAARSILASREPEGDVGTFNRHALVPKVLADIAPSLDRIELGESPNSLTLSRPVISEPNLASPNSILKNPSPDTTDTALDLATHPYRTPALYAFDGEIYGGVSVPPVWPEVYFRGRFKDGTVTPVYSLKNDDVLAGFPIEFLSAPAGFPKTNAYVYAEAAETDNEGNASYYYRLPRDASQKLIEALQQVSVQFYVELPEGAAWFTHLKVLSAPPPKNTSLAYQTIRIPYLDRYGRPFGSGVFRVAILDVRRAIEQVLVSQGVSLGNQLVPVR